MTDILHVPLVIIGGGGTGLTAALAAADEGVEALVIERDPTPLGTTAMSTGLIPAAGTPEQAAQGIVDTPELMANDILAKTHGRADRGMTMRLASQSADTVAWLRDRHGVPLELVDGFLYPGHSVRRMYGTPNRTGGELMAALENACAETGVMILADATVTEVLSEAGRVTGVAYRRPDGSDEQVRCDAIVLACSGFAGSARLVAQFIPEMADATFHGHPGNKGDAVRWGRALGARLADMGSYQGHGGLAAGHGVPILWPLIMEGGFQVNAHGERFSNEATGYSEQAARVNAQPGHVSWSIFDDRLHRLMCGFEDYRIALDAGAVREAGDIDALATLIGAPPVRLKQTMSDVAACTRGERPDRFGRDFTGRPALEPPFRAAKVTGALFHTQGGLVIDNDCRVVLESGGVIPNLFAGGGAARGVSGDGADGYLAGNGLLTATTFGKIAGHAAAAWCHAINKD